jgi:hypothetical protein
LSREDFLAGELDFIAIRWRTIRAWRKGMVIAERIGELPPEGAMSESNRLI